MKKHYIQIDETINNNNNRRNDNDYDYEYDSFIPRKMIREAIHHFLTSQNNKDLKQSQLLRIMGRVVSSNPIHRQYIHDHETMFTTNFLLDDGTASIDVIYNYSDTNIDKDKECFEHAHASLSLGECIDCVGHLFYQNEKVNDNGNDNNNSNNTHDEEDYQNSKHLCLNIKYYSKVKSSNTNNDDDDDDDDQDANFELLRILECNSTISHSARKINESGIYIYGDPISKFGPFQTDDAQTDASDTTTYSINQQQNQHQQQQHHQTLVVNTKQLYNYINHSKPEGITEDDLLLLLDCHTEKEICALKQGLKDMQANYEIYLSKTGSYLPI